jgi:hypothetical protein
MEWKCNIAGITRIRQAKLFLNILIMLISRSGGTLVSHGEISVGDLTSLLLYTVYVGSGLQMLT